MTKITQKQKNEIIKLFDIGHLLALDYIKEHFGHKNIDLLIYLSDKYGWDNSFPERLEQKYEELITEMFEDFGIDRYKERRVKK